MKFTNSDEQYYRCEYHAKKANSLAREHAIRTKDPKTKYERYRYIGVAVGDAYCPKSDPLPGPGYPQSVSCKRQVFVYRKEWMSIGASALPKFVPTPEISD